MVRRPPRSTRTDTPFPTRRSSDLVTVLRWTYVANANARALGATDLTVTPLMSILWYFIPLANLWMRSEEHTSELQSLMRISYAVFCLKKKTQEYKPAQKHITVNTCSPH